MLCGCSLTFVTPVGDTRRPQRTTCTDSYLAPGLDTAATALLGTAAWTVLSEDDIVALLGLLFIPPAVVEAISAGYGYREVARCRRASPARAAQSSEPAARRPGTRAPPRRSRAAPAPRPPPVAPRPWVSFGVGSGFPDVAHAAVSVWPFDWLTIDGRASFLGLAQSAEGGLTLHVPVRDRSGARRRSLLIHTSAGAAVARTDAGKPARPVLRFGLGYGRLEDHRDYRLVVGAWRIDSDSLVFAIFTWQFYGPGP